MRTTTILPVIFASTLLAGSALAQASKGFGTTGQVVLSADRLFGVVVGKIASEGATGITTTDSRTNIDLLFAPMPTTVYEVPRLSFDYVAYEGLTIGGSLGYFHQSGTDENLGANAQVNSSDSAKLNAFIIAPRIGYALPLADSVAFWPRVGISYYSIGSEQTTTGINPTTRTSTTTGAGLNLEPEFVFSVTHGFGIVAGPVIDLPLSGNVHSETTGAPPQPDRSVKETNYGVALGLLGYF
jgi:hypothetical protein